MRGGHPTDAIHIGALEIDRGFPKLVDWHGFKFATHISASFLSLVVKNKLVIVLGQEKPILIMSIRLLLTHHNEMCLPYKEGT